MSIERTKSFSGLRLAFGFGLMPVTAAALAAALFPFVQPARAVMDERQVAFRPDALLAFAAGVGIVATIITFVSAIPIVLVMRARNGLTLPETTAWGVILGNLPFLIVAAMTAVNQVISGGRVGQRSNYWFGTVGAFRALMLGTVIGAACATIFWLLAIRSTEPGPAKPNGP